MTTVKSNIGSLKRGNFRVYRCTCSLCGVCHDGDPNTHPLPPVGWAEVEVAIEMANGNTDDHHLIWCTSCCLVMMDARMEHGKAIRRIEIQPVLIATDRMPKVR